MAAIFALRRALPFMEIRTALVVLMTCQTMYALALPYAYRCLTLRGVHYQRVEAKVFSGAEAVVQNPQRKLSLTHVRHLKLILSSSDSEPVPIVQNLGMVELALHRKSQSEGRPVVGPMMPHISVTISCIRRILHRICTQKKQEFDRLQQEFDQLTIPERLQSWREHRVYGRNSNTVPFCRLKHLTIAPFEFPAVGESGLHKQLCSLMSVQTLELHITSGTMLSKVWLANLLEIREHAPCITKLILVFCDSSIFNREHLNLTLIPHWFYLESLDIHLKNSYSNRKGGRVWRMNEEQGLLWTTEIINQIKRLRDRYYVHKAFPPFGNFWFMSSLTLYFPAQSTFVRRPDEAVEALEASQEHSKLPFYNRLKVFIRYDEEPATSQVLPTPEEPDLPEGLPVNEETATFGD